MSCSFVIESGPRVGEVCDLPSGPAGYCGYHVQRAELTALAAKTGQTLCRKHTRDGCSAFVPEHLVAKGIATCQKHYEAEGGRISAICRGIRGKNCTRVENGTGYCGPHQIYGLATDEAEVTGRHMCSKVSCTNSIPADEGKMCEACRAVSKAANAASRADKLKKTGNTSGIKK